MRIDHIPGTDYKIIQDQGIFCFGIDSVLLSSFSKIKKDSTLIDIGAGVGILSLRCHGLYKPKKVYGVEIQKAPFELFKKSVELNGLEDKISPVNKNILDFEIERQDNIIVNPPYVEMGRGIENKNEARLIALYEKSIKLEDIFIYSSKHLKDHGKLFMINSYKRLPDMMYLARKYRLEPTRLRTVQSYNDSLVKLVMCEFSLNAGKNFKIERPLTIYESQGVYTGEVMEIYYGK